MTIGGINIKTFGMFVSSVQGLYNQPARKKTLNEAGVEAKDIVHAENIITVNLGANYADVAALKTGVEAFKTAIGGEKAFSFLNYSKTVTGHVIGGAKIEVKAIELVRIEFQINVAG